MTKVYGFVAQGIVYMSALLCLSLSASLAKDFAQGKDGLATIDSVGKETKNNIPGWCREDTGLGWSFYCDRDSVKKPTTEKKQNTSPALSTQFPFKQKIRQWRLELEEARAKAILQPTIKNITLYLTMQKQTLDKASSFAKGTQKALLQTPALDYTIKHPQGQLAKQVWYDQHNKSIEDVLQKVAGKRFGIFFFYRSSCPYCHTYAPILKAYSERYGLHTVAISLDGGAIPYFPKYIVDQGQRQRWNIKDIVPATVLYDSVKKTVMPIGYGVLTQSEISERIFMTLQEDKANDW